MIFKAILNTTNFYRIYKINFIVFHLLTLEQKKDGNFLLKNQFLEAIINPEGCVVSLILLECHKEAIATGCLGNRFVIYDDIPLYWDAWDVMDYHLETGRNAIKEVC